MATQMAKTSAQQNATLARELYEAFSTGRYERVLELTQPDVEIELVPAGQTFHGHAGFMGFMRGFADAFPDGKIQVIHQVATDDAVVSEFGFKATHTGPLRTPAGEIPPTGCAVNLRVCEVWSVRDGKLARLVNYQDFAGLLRQLGQTS